MCISPLTSKVHDRQTAAGPQTQDAAPMPFLDLKAEETMAPRTAGIAAGSCYPALCQTCLKHEERFIEITAHYLAKACNDLLVCRMLCALEEQTPPLLQVVLRRGACQKVEYAIVVDFVHANHDGVLCSLIDLERHIIDARISR